MKKITSKFIKEFRKQTRLAIAAAIGFMIAYTWKDFIIGLTKGIISELGVNLSNTFNFLSAFLITLVGVIFLLISSKLLE